MTIILWPQLSSYCPLLLMTHLPFVIHHVPDDLEMPQVVVAQQLVLLSGVEQREILHNDGWSSRDKLSIHTSPNVNRTLPLIGRMQTKANVSCSAAN